MKKLAFIINPIAGTGKGKTVINLLEDAQRNSGHEIRIFKWMDPEQIESIFEEIRNSGFQTIVAVGGDGTVNAVGSMVCRSDMQMGIIPTGSGNGLARYLGIPLDPQEALKLVFNAFIREIDVMSVNGKIFFCTAGVGFDATIAAAFAKRKFRGKYSYAQLILNHSLNYRARNYVLEIDGSELIRKAFMITVANADQFGNDFRIAPQAVIDDGKMDLCILNDFNKLRLPALLKKIRRGTIREFSAYESYQLDHLKVRMPYADWIHLDGDPCKADGVLEFSVLKDKLKIMVPIK